MTISIDERGRTVLMADHGMAIHRKLSKVPSNVVGAIISRNDVANNWEDCELGEPPQPEPPDIATEADKDAALTTLGVDMTEGAAQ